MASESTDLHPADIGTPGKRSRAGRVADLSVGTTGDARGGEDHTHTHTMPTHSQGRDNNTDRLVLLYEGYSFSLQLSQ